MRPSGLIIKQNVMNYKTRIAIPGGSMKTPKGMIEKGSSIQGKLLQPQTIR